MYDYRPPTQTYQERRKAGRVRCARVDSQFGQVLDLSKIGARIKSKKPVIIPQGKSVNLKLSVAGVRIAVPACPVANRQRPDGFYDIGFSFMPLSDEMQSNLIELARTALDNCRYTSPEHCIARKIA